MIKYCKYFIDNKSYRTIKITILICSIAIFINCDSSYIGKYTYDLTFNITYEDSNIKNEGVYLFVTVNSDCYGTTTTQVYVIDVKNNEAKFKLKSNQRCVLYLFTTAIFSKSEYNIKGLHNNFANLEDCVVTAYHKKDQLNYINTNNIPQLIRLGKNKFNLTFVQIDKIQEKEGN